MQAVINVAIAPLTTNPALWAQNPQQSRLVDELLLGMPVEITGEAEQHMVPVRTFYGYTGWVAQDALLTGPKAEEWLAQPQMVGIARWADVLAEPRVQGACVAAGLPLGARVAVQGEPEDGWQDVIIVRKVRRRVIAKLLMLYKNGQHFQNGQLTEAAKPYFIYRRAKSVSLRAADSRGPIIATVDGECAPCKQVSVQVQPLAGRVLLPLPAYQRFTTKKAGVK